MKSHLSFFILLTICLHAFAIEEKKVDVTDSVTHPRGLDNYINSIIRHVRNGDTSNIQGKATIMKNTNTLTHRDRFNEGEGNNEELMKKTQEEAKKVKREDAMKEKFEQSQKTMEEMSKNKVVREKSHLREEQDKGQEEQTAKTSAEEKKKVAEVQVKKTHEQSNKKLVQQALDRAENEKKVALQELNKKKAEEDVAKKHMEQEGKAHIHEIQQKAAAEKEKGFAEIAEKKKEEEHEKADKKKKEEHHKEQEVKKKEKEKERKRNAHGKVCDCRQERVYFDRYNLWQECPDGYLMAGMYRSSEQYVRGIQYFQCCRPCEDDGTTKLGVNNCQEVRGWESSFDSAGWSNCPDNTYMKGLYKGGCEYIYCIEWGKCCQIQQSRGAADCNAKNSWGGSFDYAGWNLLDPHKFMAGMYRSGGSHWLYNIEFPRQCNFYSFNL